MSDYPSYLLEKAVEAFNSLPGIGRRTALRLALHMLRQPKDEVARFCDSIGRFREEVKHCSVCHNISDNDICDICSNPNRDKATICVVQNVQDVMAIELKTSSKYSGRPMISSSVPSADTTAPAWAFPLHQTHVKWLPTCTTPSGRQALSCCR